MGVGERTRSRSRSVGRSPYKEHLSRASKRDRSRSRERQAALENAIPESNSTRFIDNNMFVDGRSTEDLIAEALGFGQALAERRQFNAARGGKLDVGVAVDFPADALAVLEADYNAKELKAMEGIRKDVAEMVGDTEPLSPLTTPPLTQLMTPRNQALRAGDLSPPLTGTISMVEDQHGRAQPQLSWVSPRNDVDEMSGDTLERALMPASTASDGMHDDPDMRVTMSTLDNFQNSMRQAMREQLICLKARLDDKANAEVRQIKDNYMSIAGKQSDEIQGLKDRLARTQGKLTRCRELNDRMAGRISDLNRQGEVRRICGASMQVWRDNKTIIKCKEYTADRLALRFARKRMTRVLSVWHTKTQKITRGRALSDWKSQMEIVTQNVMSQYERELGKARATIDAQKQRLDFLEAERVQFEQRMKSALMRGVSALNLEAMSFMNVERTSVPEEAPRLESSLTQDEEDMAAQAMLGSITPASEPAAGHNSARRFMRQSYSDRNLRITPRTSTTSRLYPEVADEAQPRADIPRYTPRRMEG